MQRAITGIIFVAVLIGCILGGPISFGILFAIISAAAINEFGNLVNKQEDVQMNKRICILGGIFLFLCFSIMASILPKQVYSFPIWH